MNLLLWGTILACGGIFLFLIEFALNEISTERFPYGIYAEYKDIIFYVSLLPGIVMWAIGITFLIIRTVQLAQ